MRDQLLQIRYNEWYYVQWVYITLQETIEMIDFFFKSRNRLVINKKWWNYKDFASAI